MRIRSRSSQQIEFFKKAEKSFGGVLLNKRKARLNPRPLDTRNTMHLVLRSSKAKGNWAFWRANHKAAIEQIVSHFARKNGVKILSLANVGNHLHFHMKLSNRFTYPAFIRAVTSAITMKVTGCNKDEPLKKKASDRFWDYRPFTRVIVGGYKALAYMRDYMLINQLEGLGVSKPAARVFLTNRFSSTTGFFGSHGFSGSAFSH
jgi:REP element-mobilizing transposase RayT